jgi:hypothetical protein
MMLKNLDFLNSISKKFQKSGLLEFKIQKVPKSSKNLDNSKMLN